MSQQTTLLSFLKKRPKITNENNQDVSITKDGADNQEGAFSSLTSASHASNNKSKESKKYEKTYHYQKCWENRHKWLYFDEKRGGAFCKYCEVFQKNDADILQKTKGIFITQPFTNYKKAAGKSGKLEKHSKSEKHILSCSLEEMRIQSSAKPIHTQLINESESQKIENRRSLSALISATYFLCKEEIAHTTKYEALIKKVVFHHNENLKKWASNQSERSTYISKATCSEFVMHIGNYLDKKNCGLLKEKPFSLMADESTDINNISKLSILLRFVTHNNEVKEMFLCLVELKATDAETIKSTILQELYKREFKLQNLVSCSFDGASNFAGNISGVQRKLSQEAGREIPYIHCRAHLLSLALTSARNKFPPIKRVLHVIKDIYKLFHKSYKRERVLHDMQAILEEPLLKIPESIDVRWLSNYRSVHAVKSSLISIMVSCEHIHQDGADLSSLAGGILLEIQNSSFIVILYVLEEALLAVSNLSKVLQSEQLRLSALPTLLKATVTHLEHISSNCSSNGELYKACEQFINTVSSKARTVVSNEPISVSLTHVKKFVDSMIQQMNERFNDRAVLLIDISAKFESTYEFLKINEEDVRELCIFFPDLDLDALSADIRSFKFVVNSFTVEKNVIHYILNINIGYETLKKLCVYLSCVPVSTASVERSFSTMNRILTKLRNRMAHDTLHHCMIISTEGPGELENDDLEEIISDYAKKKSRRIRLI